MTTSRICLHCHAPLTSSNTQAIDPNLCVPCWCAAAARPGRAAAPPPLPRRRRRAWPFALAGAVVALGLFSIVYLWKAAAPAQGQVDFGRVTAAERSPQPPMLNLTRIRAAEPPTAAALARARPAEASPALRQEVVGPLQEEPVAVVQGPLPPSQAAVDRTLPERIEPGALVEAPAPAAVEEPFLRRNWLDEETLREQLRGAEEVGLGNAGGNVFSAYTSHIGANQQRSGFKGPADCDPLLSLRPDLVTLSLRDGPSSQLPRNAAAELEQLSQKLRVYLNTLAPAGIDGRPRDMKVLRERLRADLRDGKPEWLRAAAVPTLTQMLMGEDRPTRLLLVELLGAVKESPATVALAHRAVFDLSAEVRLAAIKALKDRAPEVWRPVLIRGLSYPWPPPADFAAEALVRLKDVGAIPELVTLLREPRPGRPFRGPNRHMLIREVVKINHLTNCMLCHPPAINGQAPVPGIDPVQRMPGPLTTNPLMVQMLQSLAGMQGAHYYANLASALSNSISTDLGGPIPINVNGRPVEAVRVPVPVVVRADITFLRQDFSVSFPVVLERPPALQQLAENNPQLARAVGLAPPPVRFDFVVRTRAVSKAEQKKWEALKEEANPQRDAVLFALRELTGKKLEDSTEAWVKAYPLAEAEVRAVKLADRLLRQEPLAQTVLLERYSIAEGVEYTWAITRAIPRLKGAAQESARLALVRRLAREPAAELGKFLSDRDAEVRRAAVRACAQKGDRALVANLVPLVEDEGETARLAREALRRLTGQDRPDAQSWRDWLASAPADGK